MMAKAISHVKVHNDFLDYILLAKATIAQQKVLASVMKALDENQGSNSGVKLVAKHVLLIVVISAHNSSSTKDVAKTLGVHHRNVSAVISRKKLIDDNGFALWSLFVKKKRTDGLLELLKKTVINWWTLETHVNPNKSDVTQRRLEVMVYDERPTHLLMETQVLNLPFFQVPLLYLNSFECETHYPCCEEAHYLCIFQILLL
jgi:hypothetical protein